MSELQIEETRAPREKPDPDNLVFGQVMSDHMLEVPWSEKLGWGTPKICPVHTLNLHPAAKVLHYAPEVSGRGISPFKCI